MKGFLFILAITCLAFPVYPTDTMSGVFIEISSSKLKNDSGTYKVSKVLSKSKNAQELVDNFNVMFGDNWSIKSFSIFGEISEETTEDISILMQFLNAHPQQKGLKPMLILDSNGGLVYEAMAIGNILAEQSDEYSFVLLPPESKCLSSCVFIYAAAWQRMKSKTAEVGIHRPFAFGQISENTGYANHLKKYEALNGEMKNYFTKFGVSPLIVEKMNVIQSDAIQILSEDELNKLGLGKTNIAFKEFQKSRMIRLCGLDFYTNLQTHNSLTSACSVHAANKTKLAECSKKADQKMPTTFRKEFIDCSNIINN
jgi:ATP-dependent protease ClpP protease subunit